MDEVADDGGVDGHVFFVGEVEAVEIRVEGRRSGGRWLRWVWR